MCQCTPNIRTPFCGKPGCGWLEDTNKDANPEADPEIQLNPVAFAKAWQSFVFCKQECTMDEASILEAAIRCYLLYTNNCTPKRTPLKDLNMNFGTGKPSDRPEIVAAIKAEYDMLQKKEEAATKWQREHTKCQCGPHSKGGYIIGNEAYCATCKKTLPTQLI